MHYLVFCGKHNKGAGAMKKSTGLILAIIFIVVIVFIYLQIGRKGADTAKTYVEDSKGYVDQARKSINDMNKSTEEARNAADKMMGR
jgi:hypothetical protein